MNNAEKNIAFLDAVDNGTKAKVLENIATHYGISTEEAYKEVTDSEAEHLLDYMTGNGRLIIQVLMKRQGYC